jgi:hypothetical protein
MTRSEAQQIDWSTAEVKGGALSVELTRSPSKSWRKDFERVLTLLGEDGQGGWGEIALAKGRLEVAEVAEGSEGDVRHFLESAVLQVNSDLGAELPTERPAAADGPTPDQRMTATFRRFGLPMA